jgi:hypothetical protein
LRSRRLREHRGRDRLAAEDHVQGPGDADHAWQALRAARAWQQAQLHFRQAELGILVHDPVVTTKGEFEAAAQRHAGDRRNDRLGRGFDRGDQLGQVRRGEHVRTAELADVRAGREGAVATDQHDRPDRCVGLRALECGRQFTPGAAA